MTVNIQILFIYIFILYFYYSIFSINTNKCNNDGIKLYSTNMEIKNNLLKLYNNDISKIRRYINSYFNKLKINSDKDSLISLESQRMILLDSLICNKLVKHLTENQIKYHNQYIKEIPLYKKKYISKYYTEEVFFYHHGLRFSNKNILNYIYTKDIIDVGSSFGDSLLVLLNYTKTKIHLYELSKRNIKKLKITILLNNIDKKKYIIHEKGLSNFTGIMNIADFGDGGVGFTPRHKSNNIIKVNITTLDNEYLNRNIEIGFIKADVEGEGYNFIKGAENIIKLNRPVINIAIYHNYDEYFRTRYLLEDIVKDYQYEYHQHNNCEPYACEFDLFAYPSEIINKS